MTRAFSHIAGIDDVPFARDHRGDVAIVGAVFSGPRLEGVLSGRVRRDGANATERIAGMVGSSRFAPQLHAVLLQGIALAGFNVVDIRRLNALLDTPVVVVARRKPDLEAIRSALLDHVPGGRRKWQLIEQAGPMEPVAGVHIQRAGIDTERARALLQDHIRHGALPEPIRTAHLIAAGLGGSRQRA